MPEHLGGRELPYHSIQKIEWLASIIPISKLFPVTLFLKFNRLNQLQTPSLNIKEPIQEKETCKIIKQVLLQSFLGGWS